MEHLNQHSGPYATASPASNCCTLNHLLIRGKSFGLGSALESFATSTDANTIASHGANRRGVLLLDPLDIHWTAIYRLRAGVTGPMKEQYDRFTQWSNGATQLEIE